MRKSKQIITTETENAFVRILRFLTDGDIALKPAEEQILHRWNYCYKMQLQRKFTERQIAEKVAEIYGVSIWTGQNDIYNAQALFGGSIKTNKKFLLHHHAESIQLTIEKWKTDKSLVHLVPKLMEAYTRAVVAIPDEINKDKQPPPVMLFAVIEGQSISLQSNVPDAITRLKSQSKEGYIEYEENKDE